MPFEEQPVTDRQIEKTRFNGLSHLFQKQRTIKARQIMITQEKMMSLPPYYYDLLLLL